MNLPATTSCPRWLSFAWTASVALLLCLAGSGVASAEPDRTTAGSGVPPASVQRPRIGLVLSGGGARGLAHVGVLKVLEEARIPVDMIAGTSMGAIIGGLYASGMTPGEIEREILDFQWDDLFDSREPRQLLSQRRKEEDFLLSPVLRLGFRDGEFRLPSGAVDSLALENMLRRYTLPARHLASFDGLPTPFRAVATDMETGEPVILDYGNLAAALRASMSVPGFFAPLEVDGRILGDGGLVNNLPVDVARRMGADIVIAVNIGTPLAGRETLTSVLGITAQMVNILTEQNVRASIASLSGRDVLLQPDLGPITAADFGRAADLVRLGTASARAARPALERLALAPGPYRQWRQDRQRVYDRILVHAGRIGAMRFEGVDPAQAQRLAQLMKTEMGDAVNVARIEDDLQRLDATGDYERIDYRLNRLGSSRNEELIVGLQENRWGPNYFRVGLDLRTDFDGQGAFNLRVSHNRHWINRWGGEWRNRLQLGETTSAFTEFYQPLDRAEDWFVAAWADAELKRIDLYDGQGRAVAIGKRRGLRVGADVGWPLGLQGHIGEFRAGLVGWTRRASPELVASEVIGPNIPVGTMRWKEAGLRLAFVSDQLDHANFPSKGHRIQSEFIYGQLKEQDRASRAFVRMDTHLTAAYTWDRNTLNMGLRLALANPVPVGSIDEFSLGGFQQLSGYRTGQVSGNYLGFGRLTYYRRMPWNVGVARALFLGGSLELGNAWMRRTDIGFGKMRVGSSVFLGADTGVGPFYLGLVHAPQGYTGLYLLLGRP
ncbi:MAG: patatin-like phospholipase family protein [Burkholderiaceae bacterium]